MSDSYDLVRGAIENRQQVHATYAGYRRRLCPHVIGSKAGEARALFFQFGGGSARGLAPGGDWRCLPIAGLGDVSAVAGEWHTRPHSHPQTCIEEVDLKIES